MTSGRSRFVTALAWIVMIGSLVVIPISTISFLMILVGSYGTSTFDPLGFLTVVVAPPATFAAGIGLLRRKRWARSYLVALLVAIIAFNLYAMTRPPRPERTYISPSGVRTTVSGAGPGFSFVSVLIVLGSTGLLVGLLSREVAKEF